MSLRPVLLVTGLLAEARIAAGAGAVSVAGGGDPSRLAERLEAALARGVRAVISFGIAGGLEPGLKPGSIVVARSVYGGGFRTEAASALVLRLSSALPHARVADIVGVDAAVAGADEKAALHRTTGAVTVDMESHVAARGAAAHGVPFAALRVVADPAERTLPPAALVGMRPDGRADIAAVLRSLRRRPRQLPGLIRAGLDARVALAALRASRRDLDGLFDLDGSPPDGGVAVSGGVEPGAGAAMGSVDRAEFRVG